MRRFLVLLILILFCTLSHISGQVSADNISSTLEKLFSGLRTNLPAGIKTQKNDSIRALIGPYASSDSVFTHKFSDIRFLGQITSPDSLVKLITWNLILAEGGNKYYCYIIHRGTKHVKGKVYSLEGNYNPKTVRSDSIYSSSKWYGALYYDLRPFGIAGTTRYALLGIDYGNSLISRKIIDVLSFIDGDNLTFGHNCFTDGKSIVARVVFEYAASAVMSLKFESDNLIVFDHLSPFSPELKGNRQFYGPDFSFDSYIFEKDLWRLKTDIDIKNK